MFNPQCVCIKQEIGILHKQINFFSKIFMSGIGNQQCVCIKQMEKVVKTGLKIDFHIHSAASKHKDGDKVKNSTIEKIDVLISKLKEHQINVIAISDHDNFDYKLYKKLKEEEIKNNCIKLVLPAVEFSVKIDNVLLHIVTLFDDCNEDTLEKIQDIIFDKTNNKPRYKTGDDYFTEEGFLNILRQINLNTIFIVHQKGSLSSKGKRQNDANNLNNETLYNLIYIEYFEAFEFKNKKNEIFNKYYIQNHDGKFAKVNFITSTDCHDWEYYPLFDANDITPVTDIAKTFLKCLPTFRGIALAMTDLRRIKKTYGSFFSQKNSIDKLDLKINNESIEIELSNGINAIIGDNSVGKSCLIHKLTDYEYLPKGEKNKFKKIYNDYLNNNNLEIISTIKKDKIRKFDGQGYIREAFINNKMNSEECFKEYFPLEPNNETIRKSVENDINKFVEFLINKKELVELEKNIGFLKLKTENIVATSLTILEINIDFKSKEKPHNEAIGVIKSIIQNIKYLSDMAIDDDEKKQLNEFKKYLENMKAKYETAVADIKTEQNKVSIINSLLLSLSAKLKEITSDEQKESSFYIAAKKNLCENLIKLKSKDIEIAKYRLVIQEQLLEIKEHNHDGKYKFIYKSKVDKIDDEYFKDLISKPLNKNYNNIDFNNLLELDINTFKENIGKNASNNTENILEFYKQQILDILKEDFKIIPSIMLKDSNSSWTYPSPGACVPIYFDLLSFDDRKEGIYIIDQPEDDVSQLSIKTKLLDDFKRMADNRQILLITHNPQFIVNLDVDNVIFINKNKDNKIKVVSGALEYKDDQVDILKIVADNIEGGIDSLKERWKRYEKNN